MSATHSRQLERLMAVLGSNSEDWKPRVLALQEFEALVIASPSSSSSSSSSSGDEDDWSMMAPCLTVQITDLRSEVVRQCGSTLSRCCEAAPRSFARCAAKLWPALLRVASGSNNVIRSHALPACESFIAHLDSSSEQQQMLGDVLHEMRATKSKTTLKLVADLLALMLAAWPTRLLKKHAPAIEELTLGALLNAAEATCRAVGARALLLYLEHFPARSRHALMSADQRGLKLLNDARATHTPAKQAHPHTPSSIPSASSSAPHHDKKRSDSFTSIDTIALHDDASSRQSPHAKRNNSLFSLSSSSSSSSLSSDRTGIPILHSSSSTPPPATPSSPAPPSSSPSSSSSSSSRLSAPPRLAYGTRVELIESPLTGVLEHDHDAGLELLKPGRRGTVISLGERQSKHGEWAGIRLEEEEHKEEADATSSSLTSPTTSRSGGFKVVYVRPQCVRILSTSSSSSSSSAAIFSTLQPTGIKRPSRLKAPTIDTTIVHNNLSKTMASPASSLSASSSLASSHTLAATTPSSALSNSSGSTPNSARAMKTSPSSTYSNLSLYSTHSTRSIPSSPVPSSSSSSSSASAHLYLPPRAQSAAGMRTSPLSQSTPPSNLPRSTTAAAFSRSSQLPTSRIPISQSRTQSRAASRSTSRTHSRSNSNGSSLDSFSFDVASVRGSSSTGTIEDASEQSASLHEQHTLLTAHRHHVHRVTEHLGALNALLASTATPASIESSPAIETTEYSDAMIKLLSEHLSLSTGLLNRFVEHRKGQQMRRQRPQGTLDADM